MKKVKISIPQPCRENWKEMSAAEKGRHCAACNKCVIDFTQFTDRQLFKHLQNNPGTHCGRFNPGQLNHYIYSGEASPFRVRVAGIFIGLAATFGLSGKAGTHEQSLRPLVSWSPFHHQGARHSSGDEIQTTPKDTLPHIAGIVYNVEDGKAVKNATVTVSGIDGPVYTDEKGAYRIQISRDLLEKQVTLTINKKGFRDYSVSMNGSQFPSSLDVFLYPEGYHEPLMGIMIMER